LGFYYGGLEEASFLFFVGNSLEVAFGSEEDKKAGDFLSHY
jgi:hypothetical protein